MSRQDVPQYLDSQVGQPPASSVTGSRRRRPVDATLLERLAETGFLATEFGLHQQAERIFGCLAILKPGKSSPRMALAMVQARQGHLVEAIEAMRNVSKEHPDSELARAVLGSMLLHIGDHEGRELLDAVIEKNADAEAVSVAHSCIEKGGIEHGRSDETRVQLPPAQPVSASSVEFFRHYNVRP